MGGLGFSCEYPQEKFFRDCKVGKGENFFVETKNLNFYNFRNNL